MYINKKFIKGLIIDFMGPILFLTTCFIGVFVIVVGIYAVSGIECRGYENRNIYSESFIERCL